MSRSLNNFCEDLVNGTRPRYAGSQISVAEQVAYQVKKEEDARQAIFADTLRQHEAKNSIGFQSSYPQYSSSSLSTPSFSSSSTPSFSTSSFSSSSTPSFSTSSFSSSSTPSFSTSSFSSTYSSPYWKPSF